MWKAVIADDEGVILQGLKKLVDWTNMDVHLVGEARDGQQLKEVMEETDPDIVITDIMMPYRTGLDILRWCNETDMHAKFIFISGYQEFTYAKEALQSGAVDYLLKPVARKDLEDAVRKAIQKLENKIPLKSSKKKMMRCISYSGKLMMDRDLKMMNCINCLRQKKSILKVIFLWESVWASGRIWQLI